MKANSEKNEEDEQSQSLAIIVKQAEDALKSKNYIVAKSLFEAALKITSCSSGEKLISSNSYLVHRIALATYKTKVPDVVSALKEAIDKLDDLDLQHTNDSETVALAAKIEKRLYYNHQGEHHLANAILYYERAYFTLNNRYNGINLAFLYNLRVRSNLYSSKEDKVADMILAGRIRRRVLMLCERDWNTLGAKRKIKLKEVSNDNDELAKQQKQLEDEQRFWILVNKAEAHFGLGEMEEYDKAYKQAQQTPHADHMMKVFEEQVKNLGELLQEFGHLLKTSSPAVIDA